METTSWISIVLLGIGLAASSGIKTFLPLLMLSGAAKFQLFGIQLNNSFAWLGSDVALGVLLLATIIELAGDKIPVVDHALDAVGTLARPAAGALAAASVFNSADPTVAAILGFIIGAPTAFGFHAAKAGTRATSTATTAGIANPVLSVIEDVLALALAVVAFALPLLVPVLLIIAIVIIVKLFKAAKKRLPVRVPVTRGA